jgi:hypothetical protein
MLARLAVPTLTTIGLEQMNLNAHSCDLQSEIKRLYPQLDALVVLTDSDREAYSALLGAEAPPLHRIPNTVRPLSGAKEDLTAPTVFRPVVPRPERL